MHEAKCQQFVVRLMIIAHLPPDTLKSVTLLLISQHRNDNINITATFGFQAQELDALKDAIDVLKYVHQIPELENAVQGLYNCDIVPRLAS